jgi:hypothetical protein
MGYDKQHFEVVAAVCAFVVDFEHYTAWRRRGAHV